MVTHDARIFEFADRIAEMDDEHNVKVERASKTTGIIFESQPDT